MSTLYICSLEWLCLTAAWVQEWGFHSATVNLPHPNSSWQILRPAFNLVYLTPTTEQTYPSAAQNGYTGSILCLSFDLYLDLIYFFSYEFPASHTTSKIRRSSLFLLKIILLALQEKSTSKENSHIWFEIQYWFCSPTSFPEEGWEREAKFWEEAWNKALPWRGSAYQIWGDVALEKSVLGFTLMPRARLGLYGSNQHLR